MTKKRLGELADEILRDFEAGDTPARRAQTALQQARDAGDGGLRQSYVQDALRHMREVDPRRDPALAQRLQSDVLALQGRSGNSRIAHFTPGEMVIPPQFQTPELMALIRRAAAQNGIDPQRPAYDPDTGISCPVLVPRVTSPFGATEGRKVPHDGVDLHNPVGSPVFATEDGVVKGIAPNPVGGNQIIIQNDSGGVSGYAHTGAVEGLSEGDRV